ncbi:hypothetical protein [Pseudomonas sp. LP_7_YM]|uniref:hypothetical protein n=1 Tax=Pseudomonas sp. LP_7_YM TaxID=2485137 RepID=UPI00105BCC65|nr:hypothetical protein [Pseudomonas sp. LP_7_YM]
MIQVKACQPGNAARILANIGGGQTEGVIGGKSMQVNRAAKRSILSRHQPVGANSFAIGPQAPSRCYGLMQLCE